MSTGEYFGEPIDPDDLLPPIDEDQDPAGDDEGGDDE
jgi:hypothetical protein